MSRTISCLCPECTAPCWHYPGWFTPEEAERAMDAGLADHLMLDFYLNEERTYVLSPAAVGYEKKYAPEIEEMILNGLSKGRCIFLDKRTKKCKIHETDYKPYQCKYLVACSEPPQSSSTHDLKPFWDTEKGKEVVERWKQEVGMKIA